MKLPSLASAVSLKFIEEQPQILRLTTPELKDVRAPFAQNDSQFLLLISDSGHLSLVDRQLGSYPDRGEFPDFYNSSR